MWVEASRQKRSSDLPGRKGSIFLTRKLPQNCPSDFFSCLSFTQSDLWSQQAPIASVFEVQHSGYVIQAGFARSDHDSAMFVSVYPRGRAILLLYVDDIKLTGDYSVTISLIKCRLHQLFAMKALTRPKPFLGLEVAHSPRGYLVSQIK